MSSENRVLDVFGPNFLIETNGAVGVAGQLKYQIYSPKPAFHIQSFIHPRILFQFHYKVDFTERFDFFFN